MKQGGNLHWTLGGSYVGFSSYQQNDFMEILEDRHALKSTIIVGQLPVSKWFDVIGNGLIADAALDRIVHTSHRF